MCTFSLTISIAVLLLDTLLDRVRHLANVTVRLAVRYHDLLVLAGLLRNRRPLLVESHNLRNPRLEHRPMTEADNADIQILDLLSASSSAPILLIRGSLSSG